MVINSSINFSPVSNISNKKIAFKFYNQTLVYLFLYLNSVFNLDQGWYNLLSILFCFI